MIDPWLYNSLMIVFPVLFFIIALLLRKCNNSDYESLVEKLSYGEKKELEKKLKKDRIRREMALTNRYPGVKWIDEFINKTFQKHDEWLAGEIAILIALEKHNL